MSSASVEILFEMHCHHLGRKECDPPALEGSWQCRYVLIRARILDGEPVPLGGLREWQNTDVPEFDRVPLALQCDIAAAE